MELNFDGDDYCGVLAQSGMYKWFSPGDAFAWFRLGNTFAIPSGGATLRFWNYFDIENLWDFGYVEVHDLDTDEWYTLSSDATVDTVGFNYGTDNPYCPNDLEPTAYSDAGRWNAFTGSSNGWYQEEMDLSLFAGHNIELYFTYWTDPYTLGQGWYIDDIEIPEIGFIDDVEEDLGGWTINAGWERDNIVIPNIFEVNIINTVNIMWKQCTMGSFRWIDSMDLETDTQVGQTVMPVMDRNYIQSYSVMVVANQPGFEHMFGTNYLFNAHVLGRGKR
ncbi:MAG: hypothetical protein ACW96X_09980 [Promethearchaeota archaeon]